MSIQFRKSKKIGPFRLTASKSGLSVSAGVPGARVSVNSRGDVRRTVSLPGTGIYSTKKVGNLRTPSAAQQEKLKVEVADQMVYDLIASQTAEWQSTIYRGYIEERQAVIDTLRNQMVSIDHFSAADADKYFVPALCRYLDAWVAAA